MNAYTIFDDYDASAIATLQKAGIDLTVHPPGVPRPDKAKMKHILEKYDCVIIGTSQQITEDMFENITSSRIIATASVGLDHIQIPDAKHDLVMVLNTPKANAQSVAEYTMGCALSCCKRLYEGNALYRVGKNNKALSQKPADLAGKTIGVVGAGNISARIMDYAAFFGMDILCWTRNPQSHMDLLGKGVCFAELEELVARADVISVNLPRASGTKQLISSALIDRMKETAIFISVSRLDTTDVFALFRKANTNPNFYVCLDLDVNNEVVEAIPDLPNVLVTPHIAGGTIETRKRMFCELAGRIAAFQARAVGLQ